MKTVLRLQSANANAIFTPGVAVAVDDKKVDGVELAEVAADESAIPTPTDADAHAGSETPKSRDTDKCLTVAVAEPET